MWAKFWTWVKTYLFKFVGGLFMDEKAGTQVISLGRVLLLIVFTVLLVNWHEKTTALPDGLMAAFYTLLGYVFGSKAVQTVQGWAPFTSSAAKTSEEPVEDPK